MSNHIDKEEPLTGGRITQGVVKIGATVHRHQSGNSDFAHSLLRFLEERSAPSFPRFLGIDDQDREILTYVEGEVPLNLRSDWSDTQLVQATKMIRNLHDALEGSELAGSEETVCHNDLSPCNFTFIEGMPSGIIDFDAAAPGSRLSDLAYAIWMWLDLGGGEVPAAEQARRMLLMLASYGPVEKDGLLAMIDRRQCQIQESMAMRGDSEAAAWMKRENQWLHANWTVLDGILNGK